MFMAGCLLGASVAMFADSGTGQQAGTDEAAKQAPAVPAKLVNINTATRQELESVPGIGRTLAERIIAGRPYAAVDDLKRIEGMGAKTLEKAKPHLTTGS
jgi:competence ComEA-like helix-hairpin-helix protein